VVSNSWLSTDGKVLYPPLSLAGPKYKNVKILAERHEVPTGEWEVWSIRKTIGQFGEML
jgi:hypothetical protein